ncbi:hypothetical protein L7F22_003581 [Adiantum nelumboides]|nr:hypothetical protein [Adiantum nelumboides]
MEQQPAGSTLACANNYNVFNSRAVDVNDADQEQQHSAGSNGNVGSDSVVTAAATADKLGVQLVSAKYNNCCKMVGSACSCSIIRSNADAAESEKDIFNVMNCKQSKKVFKRICVFCGSKSGHKAVFSQAALQLGRELVDRNIELVYGGGSIGLMGLISRTVFEGGCRVLGYANTNSEILQMAEEAIGEMRVVADMHERKAEMARQADAFIAMPGGYGTLEELLEMITWSQLGIHDKPVGVLNIDGYYDSLLKLFDKSVEEGFMKIGARQIVISAPTPKELLTKMQDLLQQRLPKAIGGELQGVQYICYVADANALGKPLQICQKLVVIGGGYIGMEVNVASTAWNFYTMMIFLELHIMPRLFTPSIAAKYEELLSNRGVKLNKDVTMKEIVSKDDQKVSAIELSDGTILDVYTVVVGIGAKLVVGPFLESNLCIAKRGIEVDGLFRTSSPNIWAIGDVVTFPLKMFNQTIRVEHDDHARKSAQHYVDFLLQVHQDPSMETTLAILWKLEILVPNM